MTDNFECYVCAAREKIEADARYRNRTREERKRKTRCKRIALVSLYSIMLFALVFGAVSGLCSDAEAVAATAVPQSSEEPCGAEYAENPNENELIEQALLSMATKIESCRVTYYCAEPRKHICGYGLGITKSGRELVPHWSCAVDPSVIPLGASVFVDFGDGEIVYLSADDTGGAVKGNHIDICLPTHKECFEQPYNTATVYWLKEGE